jgi:hypothetical protein
MCSIPLRPRRVASWSTWQKITQKDVRDDKKPGKHTVEVKQMQTNEHTWYDDDLLPKDWPWRLWNGCSDATRSSTWSERNSNIENRNYEKVKAASYLTHLGLTHFLRNMLYVLVPARDCREGVTCRDSFFLSMDGYGRGTRAPRQKKLAPKVMLTGAQHLQSIVQFYTKALF